MTEKPDRIAKAIAAAGVCSRRDAERLIAEGRVMLNGKRLDTPAITVTAADTIVVDGKPLRRASATQMPRLWLYHKPAGLVTTHRDPEGRPTVFDDLPRKMGRVLSVGRLDLNSEGLLLLTDSGALSRHLELPKNALPRYYRVRVYGDIDDSALDELRAGVTLDGVHYRGMDIEYEEPDSRAQNQWLHMTLFEGKNREIRRVMQAMGLHVNRLIRTGYGPFELGQLAIGKTTEVPPAMLAAFLKNIGFTP